MTETCQNCRFNEAAGEPMENIGYCDIRDKEFVNSTPRPWNCKEFEKWLSLKEKLE